MNLQNYKYVVVEGPIGAGKTTLTKKIAAHIGAQVLLEQPESNPFLEKFYYDPTRYALATQMFFLLQRINQLRDLAQSNLFNDSVENAGAVVSDFLLDKDPIFANLTLVDDELKMYQQLYNQLRPQTPTPDLVIYLQAEPDKLIERIKKRGIPMESGITPDYLKRLCESYSRFFYDYEAAPLLIVNNEHMDLSGSDADFELLLARIDSMRGKREFFNRGE